MPPYILCEYALNVNRDIKPSNILIKFNNVKEEENMYWKYIIKKKTYYVPNCGITCLFTDFGVSRTFSPKLQLSNGDILKLGTRLAIHDVDNDIFIPLIHKEKNKNKIKWIENSDIISYPVRTYLNLKK